MIKIHLVNVAYLSACLPVNEMQISVVKVKRLGVGILEDVLTVTAVHVAMRHSSILINYGHPL